MNNSTDLLSNRIRFILHGVFFAGTLAIAEPSTILPLIVNYFGGSDVLVGFYSSLLRGGAVLMQLYAAYYAQSYLKVLNKLRLVLLVRFLAWFGIGLSIFIFGTTNPGLALILFGVGLFIFSFSAGFGIIYYNELLGKSFTNEYRGKSFAYRQFFAGLSAICCGGIAGWLLNIFEKPMSFAYLFMFSAAFLIIGYIALGTFKETEKTNITKREKSFKQFLNNSFLILKKDKNLRIQIISMLLSYSFLFSFPFIILQAKENFSLSGTIIGTIVSLQMTGAMLSNIIWGRLSAKKNNKMIVILSFLFIIASLILSINTSNIYMYYVLFFLAGCSIDGFRMAYNNLILIIAPEEKRPVYIAIQNNITILGLFFSIIGGVLLTVLGFNVLVIFTIVMLIFGLLISLKLKKN